MGKDDEKVENGEYFQNYSKVIYLQLLGFFTFHAVWKRFSRKVAKKGIKSENQKVEKWF